MMKCLLVYIAAIFPTIIFGQTDNAVFLKWKLQPKEVIVYKTVMEEIDTANFKSFSLNFGGLFKLFDDSTDKAANGIKSFFSNINNSLNNYDFITTLRENRKGIIDIEMNLKEKADASFNQKDSARFFETLKSMTGDVMLRGAVDENGSIKSFYVKNDQKNLIAMMFQLPAKPVTIGDKWSLDINLISMDQHFTCDTSLKKNMVTLIDIKKNKDETIAVLKYDILEFIAGDFKSPLTDDNKKTIMKMSFNAIAEFSITKGRWYSYDGILSLFASGVMTSNTTKKFTLLGQ